MTDNNIINLKSFELISSDKSTASLSFELFNDNLNFDSLKPIPYSKQDKTDLLNMISVASGLSSLSNLASFSGKNLFKATVSPDLLIKYTSGNYASMIRGAGGQISGHSGFVNVGVKCFTPLLAFQVLAMMTGQYYLHGITKQLNELNQKVDKLLELHEIERKAKIRSAFISLTELAQRSYFTQDDLYIIQSLQIELQTLREEYKLRMEGIIADKSITQDNKTFNKTNVQETVANIERSNFFMLNELGFLADKLYFISKILYFKALLGQGEFNNGVIKKIETNLSLFSDDSFTKNFGSTQNLYKLFEARVNKHIQTQLESASFYNDSIKDMKNKIIKDFKQFDYKKEKTDFLNLASSILNSFKNEKEIYISIKDSDVDIYLKD